MTTTISTKVVFLLLVHFTFLGCLAFIFFTTTSRKPLDIQSAPDFERFPRRFPYSRCPTIKLPPSMLTAFNDGRLGNQMFLYATLFSIAKMNNRTAYMSPHMTNHISEYFNVSMAPINKFAYYCTDWEIRNITRNRAASLGGITNITAPYVRFEGFAESYKYFHENRELILKEFKFQDDVQKSAEEKIREAIHEHGLSRVDRGEITLVGIHVRRADYIYYARATNTNLPTLDFYVGAMKYFQRKYKTVLYIVTSDDIWWCWSKYALRFVKEHFRVKFLEGNSTQGGDDLAVQANCNHTIFGVGTFGFWSAYLSGGETIFCSDCVTEDSRWMETLLDYRNFVLPEWKGVNRKGEFSDKLAIVKNLTTATATNEIQG